jgi:hypothetical protein
MGHKGVSHFRYAVGRATMPPVAQKKKLMETVDELIERGEGKRETLTRTQSRSLLAPSE